MESTLTPFATQIRESIEQGLQFLVKYQQPGGAWHIWVADNAYFSSQPRELVDVFTTAFILREIAGIDAETVPEICQRACEFLLKERRNNGLWRFYKKGDLRLLPTDFDTTSVAATALILSGYTLDPAPVLEELTHYQHPAGGYWVYTMPPESPEQDWIYPLEKNYHQEHVIDAHILCFLAAAGADCSQQLEYLREVLDARQYETPQLFYDAPILFLYNLARYTEYQGAGREFFRRHLMLHALKQTIWDNMLHFALLVGTLAHCEADPLVLRNAVERLLTYQNSDGGWPLRHLHYTPIHFYGCREVTTAVAIHALHRVQAIMLEQLT